MSEASERQLKELKGTVHDSVCQCGHERRNHHIGKLRTYYCHTPQDFCLCPMFRKRHNFLTFLNHESPYRKRPQVKAIGSAWG